MGDNIMSDIMRNNNKVLDMRNKINSYFDYDKCTYKYYINLYQDKLKIIEVLLFNCQIKPPILVKINTRGLFLAYLI